jgi:Ulp1 protease family, C-terminal catalytic domain
MFYCLSLPQDFLAVDIHLLQDIQSIRFGVMMPSEHRPRILLASGELPTYHFEQRDLDILKSPTARFNDVGINGGAALLHRFYLLRNKTSAERCALLSTFDLPRVRYNASDEELWRYIHRSSYWQKDVWILPIHRKSAEHWVLCVITLREHQLYLFDSLAARRPWRQDVKDIMCLVNRMVLLANIHQHPLQVTTEDWCARPVLVCTFTLLL